MRKVLTFLLTGLALFASGLFIGHRWGWNRANSLIKPKVEYRTVTDVITHEMPVYMTEYIDRTEMVEVPVWDTVEVHHHDTTFISLPKMVREYGDDSTYFARVSGYKPSLDYIEVYRKTQYVTETIVKERSRWSFGLNAGVGAQYDILHKSVGFGPQVGFGINYNFR